MKTNRLILALIGCLALAGCSKEAKIVGFDEATGRNLVSVSMNASIERDTRVTIDGYTPKWSDGDDIKVYYNVGGTYGSVTFNLVGAVGGTNTLFEGVVPEGAELMFAVYPESAAGAFDGTNITYNLPNSYDKISAIGAPMYGKITGEKVKFRNVTALMKVNYQINGDWGGTPNKYRIASSDHQLSGSFTMRADDEDYLKAIPATTSNSITYDIASTDFSGSEVVLYVPVPEGDYTRFASEFLENGTRELINTAVFIKKKDSDIIFKNNIIVMPKQIIPEIIWLPVPDIEAGKYYIMIYQDEDGEIHVANWQEMDLNVRKNQGFVAHANTSDNFTDLSNYHILYAAPGTSNQLTSYVDTEPHYDTGDAHHNMSAINYQINDHFYCNNWNPGQGQFVAVKYVNGKYPDPIPGGNDEPDIRDTFGAVNRQNVGDYPAPQYYPVTLLEYQPAGYPVI